MRTEGRAVVSDMNQVEEAGHGLIPSVWGGFMHHVFACLVGQENEAGDPVGLQRRQRPERAHQPHGDRGAATVWHGHFWLSQQELG